MNKCSLRLSMCMWYMVLLLTFRARWCFLFNTMTYQIASFAKGIFFKLHNKGDCPQTITTRFRTTRFIKFSRGRHQFTAQNKRMSEKKTATHSAVIKRNISNCNCFCLLEGWLGRNRSKEAKTSCQLAVLGFRLF